MSWLSDYKTQTKNNFESVASQRSQNYSWFFSISKTEKVVPPATRAEQLLVLIFGNRWIDQIAPCINAALNIDPVNARLL